MAAVSFNFTNALRFMVLRLTSSGCLLGTGPFPNALVPFENPAWPLLVVINGDYPN